MLPDHVIRKYIEEGIIAFDPFDPSAIQPASIDMHLDNHFRFYPKGVNVIDPRVPERRTRLITLENANAHYCLDPGNFVVASTYEKIGFPNDIGGRIEGKSSLGRMGLFVHVTAGFIDPGFYGNVTLELCNVNPNPILLIPGMPICQMSFHRMDSPCERPYGRGATGSKYTDEHAKGPVESMYYKNFQDLNVSDRACFHTNRDVMHCHCGRALRYTEKKYWHSDGVKVCDPSLGNDSPLPAPCQLPPPANG